jgi:hypothetical protein
MAPIKPWNAWFGKKAPKDAEPKRIQRASPPAGARHWILLILDSCRYDTFLEANPTTLRSLGTIEKRWSYATWTAPSHYNLMIGLLPHSSPPATWSADVYRMEYARYKDRLGVSLDMSQLAPELWLPEFLRTQGWHTGAFVSLPALNPASPINRGFDHYQMRSQSNDFAGIIEDLRFYKERPSFWLLNTGETHYPYERPDREYPPLPRLSGVHGTVRKSGVAPEAPAQNFDAAMLASLRERQVDAVRYIDGQIEALRDMVPDNTWLTVTSDHGECFGEGGYFGHGPMHHEKVLEVPLVEGLLR